MEKLPRVIVLTMVEKLIYEILLSELFTSIFKFEVFMIFCPKF